MSRRRRHIFFVVLLCSSVRLLRFTSSFTLGLGGVDGPAERPFLVLGDVELHLQVSVDEFRVGAGTGGDVFLAFTSLGRPV